MAAEHTSHLNALDKICDDYEQSLPETPNVIETIERLNTALHRAPEHLRHTLLQLLLELEFEHRLMKNQPIPRTEFLQHFSDVPLAIDNALAAAQQRTGLAGTLAMSLTDGGSLSPPDQSDHNSPPNLLPDPGPQQLHGHQSPHLPLAQPQTPQPPQPPQPPRPPQPQTQPQQKPQPHNSLASLWCMISGDGIVATADQTWDEEIG